MKVAKVAPASDASVPTGRTIQSAAGTVLFDEKVTPSRMASSHPSEQREQTTSARQVS